MTDVNVVHKVYTVNFEVLLHVAVCITVTAFMQLDLTLELSEN